MNILFKQLFIITFLGLIPFGCENDPTSPPEVHTDADGFVLKDESGIEIYREFEGATTGSISINVGEELELIVHFLDHTGNELEDEEDHDDHENDESELKITGFDISIAVIEVEEHEYEHCGDFIDEESCNANEHCEWHDNEDEGVCEDEGSDSDHGDEENEHEELLIHITGVSAGMTEFKLELMHGEHADYTSFNNVVVIVNEQN